ncbi:exported hypothetical protein [Paraburkholderia piptadeniae]|uniref:Uncharacterized protein n=1 Tax=Paraburkholderia piptadeniae TaxID=1701573 RepID=A0A1N7RIU0_9BURK|nr:exported hypothetical protein [Paraburkholderia piptadeniae]
MMVNMNRALLSFAQFTFRALLGATCLPRQASEGRCNNMDPMRDRAGALNQTRISFDCVLKALAATMRQPGEDYEEVHSAGGDWRARGMHRGIERGQEAEWLPLGHESRTHQPGIVEQHPQRGAQAREGLLPQPGQADAHRRDPYERRAQRG